jgi:enediyne biosynthesis protein E4
MSKCAAIMVLVCSLLGQRFGSVAAQSPAVNKPPAISFADVSAASGLSVAHVSTPEKRYIVESMSGGAALLDCDGDERLDVAVVNGSSVERFKAGGDPFVTLYRQAANAGGPPKFENVTAAAGLVRKGWGMGVTAVDYDNDGRVDLFVTGYGGNVLYRGTGPCQFQDVTERAGLRGGGFATGAAWADYDRDGRLDVFVARYVSINLNSLPEFGSSAATCNFRGVRVQCGPRGLPGESDTLYRNRGDGTFEDVSTKAGLLSRIGKGMSVAFADFDHDGRLDAFVTNDTVPNFLFHNNGDGTFREDALIAGVAVPESGRPVSGMGTDAQDYDNDGWEDLHFTALAGETFPLFRNDGHGRFIEATQSSGLARATAKLSGWCSVMVDLDNDGRKDIFTANSHANDRIGDSAASGWKQANSLFVNDGEGRFHDATAEAGLAAAVAAHRGCGVADFDGDGRLDVVVLVLGARAELWQNDGAAGNHWLTVRLTGTKSNRDGIGARVLAGNQVRTMTTAAGYASSSHAGVHFGLGTATEVPRLEIQWPSGMKQVLEHVKTDQVLEVGEK